MLVLIVDDHPLLRQALREVIETTFPLLEVREATTAEEAIRIVKAAHVELVLLDIMLPDHNGLTVLKRIKQLRPPIKCLVLTVYDAPHYERLAIAHGASGYLTKGVSATELCEAIRTILSGRQVFAGPLNETRNRRLRRSSVRRPQAALSVRELEVLSFFAQGRTASQIAKRLKLSIKTVSTYRTRLLQKLSLETTADLIRYAIDHQLV